MSLGDKAVTGELKGGLSQDEEGAHAGGDKPTESQSYRGDLNGAYQKWREGGQPADPHHPLTK